MKISNDVVDELKKIRNAVDDMYDEVNVTLFEKKDAAKTWNPDHIENKNKKVADAEKLKNQDVLPQWSWFLRLIPPHWLKT